MEWKAIPNFPGYVVSDEGTVENVVSGDELALNMNQYDVVYVALWYEGQQHMRSVPLLVANAFISKPYPAFDTPINVDGNRWNNFVYNLLWRPRSFAVKYNRQFKESYHGHISYPIQDLATGDLWPNSLECARAYGLLEEDIVESIMNRTYAWPTYQQFGTLGTVY